VNRIEERLRESSVDNTEMRDRWRMVLLSTDDSRRVLAEMLDQLRHFDTGLATPEGALRREVANQFLGILGIYERGQELAIVEALSRIPPLDADKEIEG